MPTPTRTNITGSISAGVWGGVCKRVLVTGEILVVSLRQQDVPGGSFPRMCADPAAQGVPVPVQQQQAQPGAKIEELGVEHDKLD